MLGSEALTSRFSQLAPTALAAAFYFGLVTINVRLSRPFFGNMDDSNFLMLAGTGDPLDFFVYYASDFSSGFLRVASWVVVWPLYWLSSIVGSAGLYVTNAAVVIAALLVFIGAYYRLLRWRNPWLIPLALGATFLWPYTAELFVFPSLQEKAVVLGAGLLLLWATWGIQVKSNLVSYITLTATTVFAFNTKTQIVVFVPGLVLAALVVYRRLDSSQITSAKRRVLVAAALWGFASLLVIILAFTGSYTTSVRDADAVFSVSNTGVQLMGVAGAVFGGALLVRKRLGLAVVSELVVLSWLLFGFCAFALWGPTNYSMSLAGVILGVSAGTAASWFQMRRRSLALLAIVLCLLSGMWLQFRLPQFYEATGSVRNLLTSSVGVELSRNGALVEVSCDEAPLHYNRYAESFDLAGLTFVSSSELRKHESTPDFIWSDQRLCPLPPSSLGKKYWDDGSRHGFTLWSFART